MVLTATISIHAPLTGSDGVSLYSSSKCSISIHAPLTGSDGGQLVGFFSRGPFQSTLPLRGATVFLFSQTFDIDISIHAPLTGSDNYSSPRQTPRGDFYPRSPYGERRMITAAAEVQAEFQSTLPLRGATTPPDDAKR